MKNYNTAIILVFFLTLPLGSFADTIYTWTDSQGERHYSNTPSVNADIVTLPEATVIAPNNFPTLRDKDNQITTEKKEKSLLLISPKNNQTFHYKRHKISILANDVLTYLNMDKQNQIQIILNGKITLTTRAYPIQITTPDPGTYQLKIAIYNPQKKIIAQSTPITIYILPYPRISEAGTTPASAENYQNETKGKNYQEFYSNYQNALIQPQTPYQPTWQDYEKQINP